MLSVERVKQLLLEGEKVDIECKEAKNSVPKSIYETYSAFSNTNGGIIFLGVKESRNEISGTHFDIIGVNFADKIIDEFWNTINSAKVSTNILNNDNVYKFVVEGYTIIVIEVPRADYKTRPIYINDNPYKGTLKRNNQGDYHCTEEEVKAMIRDQNSEGNDGQILEYYTLEDIDRETLAKYRNMFSALNTDHIWNVLDDKEFLTMLGAYGRNRANGTEGLTLAGLLMFGKGIAVREKFPNILMDYREETQVTKEVRWNDRITYDGTWENNLFNFFMKVIPKLTSDLKKPFKLVNGIQRIDDTAIHKAIREAFVNMIIHADYLSTGTLKVIKKTNKIEFTNPGNLKLPKEDIYRGGNSKARNPKMQTILRMIGFGDNAGSGFPKILSAWKECGWEEPIIEENTVLNQVVLVLPMEELKQGPQNCGSFAEVFAEVLSMVEYKKMEPIIRYLEENDTITTQQAVALTGKSDNTARKYLNILVQHNILRLEGNTNNSKYIKIKSFFE